MSKDLTTTVRNWYQWRIERGIAFSDRELALATAFLQGEAGIVAVPPHEYHPSVMHMGDCSVCGGLQDEPQHKAPSASDSIYGDEDAAAATAALAEYVAEGGSTLEEVKAELGLPPGWVVQSIHDTFIDTSQPAVPDGSDSPLGPNMSLGIFILTADDLRARLDAEYQRGLTAAGEALLRGGQGQRLNTALTAWVRAPIHDEGLEEELYLAARQYLGL